MQLNTLKSIARLFAIVADRNNDTVKENYIKVFTDFLNELVDEKYVGELKNEFELNLSITATGSSPKKLSLNSVKLISLLEELKNKLSVIDRHIVIVYVILLTEETSKSEASTAFIKEVASSFSVQIQVVEEIREFISKSYPSINCEITKENLLSVDNGVLLFKVYKIGFKHNGINIRSNRICVLTKDSVLSDEQGRNYFYPEIEAILKSGNQDAKICLSVRNLEYKKKGHTLVHKMSLDIDSSQMIAVIGNSGSGKTSFLKCISGQTNDFSGIVHYSTVDQTGEPTIAYVPQENSFVPGLSVEEHLVERCRFLQFDLVEFKEKCNYVLDFVGLNSVINNKVCKTDFSIAEISGGQQKRLSIATELLSSPDVIILDEPTSGLSSEDSYDILSKLKKLSLSGKLVIASIHQPDFDLFMMFDQVLIFADGGFPVYYGAPAKAAEYFRGISGRVDKNSDFVFSKKPSVILNLLSNNKEVAIEGNISTNDLYGKFVEASPSVEPKVFQNTKSRQSLSRLKSFLYFLGFGIRADLKHFSRFLTLLIVPLISGVVLSAVCRFSPGDEYVYFYNPNLPVWILILLTTSVFIGLASSGHEFIYLRQFYNTLHAVSGKRLPHVSAVFLRYFLLTAIQTVLLVLPSVFIIGSQFHFVSVFLFSFALCLWGSIAGLVLSYIMKTTMTVYLIIPLLIIPQLVFSGALINFKHFNKIIDAKSDIPLIAEIVPMRWAAEGLMLEFYTNNPYSSKIYATRCELYNAVYYSEFFLPEVLSIFKEDSTKAVLLLKNEESKNGFIGDKICNTSDVNLLVNSYDNIKSSCIVVEDSILASLIKPDEIKLKYSNLAIEKVIDAYNSGSSFQYSEGGISRTYKSAFKMPQEKNADYSYFTPFRSFANLVIITSNYNLIVIFMLCLFNCCFLILAVQIKCMRKYVNSVSVFDIVRQFAKLTYKC
ncbi:MAG: ATP-binding cassette domain-containing protein [Bacteroidales bacterium]|nr:ATP-binding cassette domain-containing protein [Bacteroidales bacterium]